MIQADLVVIGGGPAGLAAAYAAAGKGVRNILILEREKELGGILNQCIHNGFGLHYFKKQLTGPEYAGRFIEMVEGCTIEIKLDTMVLSLSDDHQIRAINPVDGYMDITATAIVLAMGCRERTRGAIAIPGDRPAGVMTAGTAQRYVNMEGAMVGRRIVILGSGDIGLIMARRMTLEGAEVLACVELMPYSNGLTRNIVQCLDDFNIPLYLSHTITNIVGKSRVEKVVISEVDDKRQPIPGTEKTLECDTVLLSVGLIPENELSRQLGAEIDARTGGLIVYENMQTSVPGVFASGNVVHVHDLVDFVTEESERAGSCAADYILSGKTSTAAAVTVQNGQGVSYTVPQKIRVEELEAPVNMFYRVTSVFKKAVVTVSSGDTVLLTQKRPHMAPGEMERIKLTREILAQAKDGKVTISVAEEEAK